jgi:predicted amidophosphoribosyltransferase
MEEFIPYVRTERKRKTKPPRMICGKCGQKHDRVGQRVCLACHAQIQKEYRRKRQAEYERLKNLVSRGTENVSRETPKKKAA